MDRIQESKLKELIGRNVKRFRMEKGMTQDEFSKVSGVDRSMLSKIENGLVFPSMKVFLSICIGLKITLDTLLEGWQELT